MTHPLFDLSNKTALITGSSQGIGYTLAAGLASAGATIVVNGRDAAKLTAAADRMRDGGATVHELVFDVTDHHACRAAVDGFEKLMATNVTSVFSVGQAVARHMIARGAGKIINIASVQTALARPGIAPYTTSKGAVANLTKGMATDWAPKGLQVNAIAPGYFNTPLNAALVADADFTAWVAKRAPAGRWGQLPELQGACIFLASDGSSFINGQTLFVDGGMTACL
jgi:gluconate 5-dehydrogenase